MLGTRGDIGAGGGMDPAIGSGTGAFPGAPGRVARAVGRGGVIGERSPGRF
jgi:hypothetical protein